jgi:hypothetical protein
MVRPEIPDPIPSDLHEAFADKGPQAFLRENGHRHARARVAINVVPSMVRKTVTFEDLLRALQGEQPWALSMDGPCLPQGLGPRRCARTQQAKVVAIYSSLFDRVSPCVIFSRDGRGSLEVLG